MVALSDRRLSVEEYLAFERKSPERHEFVDGIAYMMSGASRNHNLVCVNVVRELSTQLRGKPCETYTSDMRVRIRQRDYVYPDIVVVCSDPRLEGDDLDVLLNPALIIEVLSPSTEPYDRSRNFESYRALESLQEYVLIAQNRPHIEQYGRQEKGVWQFSEVNGLEATLELPSIGVTVTLASVYERVTFEEQEPWLP